MNDHKVSENLVPYKFGNCIYTRAIYRSVNQISLRTTAIKQAESYLPAEGNNSHVGNQHSIYS
jgi:hypothetical protein